MINLFKVKEKQKEIAKQAAENENASAVKKQSAGKLRLQKDMRELNPPDSCSLSFPNGQDDLMHFELTIKPKEGYYYKTGTFVFTFQVPSVYPHEPPKVNCKTKVYHPNIDEEGNTCLNILREDWNPIVNLNTVIYGLVHLFTEPSHEDSLNHDAATLMRDSPSCFGIRVENSIASYESPYNNYDD